MQYIEISNKSVQEVVNSIKEVASKYSFGVLNVLNIQETLKSKGKNLENECQIIDICKPSYAEEFLNEDIVDENTETVPGFIESPPVEIATK